MEQELKSLASWLERTCGAGRPQFNPPASDAQISHAENRLGNAFPGAVRHLYRLADGQPPGAIALEGSFILLSLEGIIDAADFLNEEFPDEVNVHDPDHAPMDADAGIRAVWWSRNWVPVMGNGGGDYFCFDLDPAP